MNRKLASVALLAVVSAGLVERGGNSPTLGAIESLAAALRIRPSRSCYVSPRNELPNRRENAGSEHYSRDMLLR